MNQKQELIAAILTVPVALKMEQAHIQDILRAYHKINKKLGEDKNPNPHTIYK